MMTLRGARLALLEETPEARHLNVKRLKDVLGCPTMTARHIRQDSVSWSPTHSLFISTNYRPRVDETDRGTWRRLALVLFPYTYRSAGESLVGPNDRPGDPALRQRLEQGRDGRHEAVLAWLVEGAQRWYAASQVMPAPPDRVADDTREWRHQSDAVLRWFDENLVVDPDYCVASAELFEVFTESLRAGQHTAWTLPTFTERFGQHDEIVSAGIVAQRVRASASSLLASRPAGVFKPLPERYRAWVGVRFRTDADERPKTDNQGKRDPGTGGTDNSDKPPKNSSRETYPKVLSHPSQAETGSNEKFAERTPPNGSTNGHDARTRKQVEGDRYRTRQCIDCGGTPSAGRPRCDGCHKVYLRVIAGYDR